VSYTAQQKRLPAEYACYLFLEAIKAYISHLQYVPTNISDLAGLIHFNNENAHLELPEAESDQSLFLKSVHKAPVADNRKFIEAKEQVKVIEEDIKAVMKEQDVTVLVSPSDSFFYNVAARIGMPSITVPAGFLRSKGVAPTTSTAINAKLIWPFNGAPAGLCFVSDKWQEETLLEIARGFEVMQQRSKRGGYDDKVRTFKEATPQTQLKSMLA
jgi:hypothetical protein